jgi:hypothetical protein
MTARVEAAMGAAATMIATTARDRVFSASSAAERPRERRLCWMR